VHSNWLGSSKWQRSSRSTSPKAGSCKRSAEARETHRQKVLAGCPCSYRFSPPELSLPSRSFEVCFRGCSSALVLAESFNQVARDPFFSCSHQTLNVDKMSNNYGTAQSGQQNAANGANGQHATEQDALLPKKNDSKTDFRKYFGVNVHRTRADIVLLFSYITTGLLDSAATAEFGSFVSMQTGNTVYVGLGLSNPTGSTRWIKSGTSILAFCLGSFLFARYHRRFSVRRRWVLISSTLIQLLCVIAAALIVTFASNEGEGGNHDKHWHVLLPLGLVAFQSAGQAVVSRALNYNALTSVVLTSIYCDLFMDAKLFASFAENPDRNRRVAAPLLLLVGAIMGGAWARSDIGITGALWTAAVLKLAVMATWIFWPAEEEAQD